jgi:hypothetical protein
MAWRVEIQEQAMADLRRLDPEIRRRILKYFEKDWRGAKTPGSSASHWLATGPDCGGIESEITERFATSKTRS